jgi:hypothetical protein
MQSDTIDTTSTGTLNAAIPALVSQTWRVLGGNAAVTGG